MFSFAVYSVGKDTLSSVRLIASILLHLSDKLKPKAYRESDVWRVELVCGIAEENAAVFLLVLNSSPAATLLLSVNVQCSQSELLVTIYFACIIFTKYL